MTNTEAPTTWDEKRRRRLLVTSASQFETFELCPRKWWLDDVRKLPVPQTTPQTFGDVLHAVCERYLNADDLGRDSQGHVVNLYPQGWESVKNRFDGSQGAAVTPLEANQIQTLVQQAIEKGVLKRLPGRQIEKQFRKSIVQLGCPKCEGQGIICSVHGTPSRLVCDTAMEPGRSGECGLQHEIKCPDCGGDGKGTHIQIQGFIDVLFRDRVEDHKTTKNMKYAKSKNALKSNIQMLIYAKVALDEALERGEPPPTEITLRHNVYCKDPENTTCKETEVVVTPAEVEAHWKEITNKSLWMDFYRRVANRWHDLPEPPSPNACRAYGGCQFVPICSGIEDEEGYERRLALAMRAGYSVTAPALPIPLTVNGHTPFSRNETMTQAPPQPPQSFAAGIAKTGRGPVQGMAPPQISPAPMMAPAMAPAPQAGPGPQQGWQPQPQPQPQAAPAPQGAANPYNPAYYAQQAGQAPAAPQAAPMPVAQPPAQQNVTAPPWAVQGCNACNGWGFSTDGRPCRICDHQQTQRQGPTSALFTLEYGGPNLVKFTAKDNSYSGLASLVPGTVSPYVAQQQAPQQAPQQPPAPMQAPQGTPQGAPAPAPQGDGEPEGKPGRRAPGRPAKGYVYIQNCAVAKGAESKGDRTVLYCGQMFNSLTDHIAKSVNAPDFYSIDAFKRRDLISQYVPAVIAELPVCFVVASNVGTGMSDYKHFCDCIRASAGCEIVPEAMN